MLRILNIKPPQTHCSYVSHSVKPIVCTSRTLKSVWYSYLQLAIFMFKYLHLFQLTELFFVNILYQLCVQGSGSFFPGLPVTVLSLILLILFFCHMPELQDLILDSFFFLFILISLNFSFEYHKAYCKFFVLSNLIYTFDHHIGSLCDDEDYNTFLWKFIYLTSLIYWNLC